MPIANYSVLAGRPTAGKVVSGASAHYQITMQAAGGPFTVAVNIQSVNGSEVLYAIEEGFTSPDLAALLALPMEMTKLKSVPGGLALDFVRSTVGGGAPMITKADSPAKSPIRYPSISRAYPNGAIRADNASHRSRSS